MSARPTRPADELVEVTTSDGWRLELAHLSPRGRFGEPRRRTLLCGPAMMADRRSLDRPRGEGLGSFFARAGYDVYLLDPRGHGGSGPEASRSVNWSYDDIVLRDLPVAIRAAKERHPEQPLVLLGHSLCGHGGAASLGVDQSLPVDALVMLASNVWLPRLEPSRAHWLSKRALLHSWTRITRLRGFFPARALRLGSADEARSYVAQFETWARSDRWCSESGRVDYLKALEEVSQPTLSVSARGDKLLCRTICARRFAWHFRRSALTFWEVGARELGRRGEPKHMDLAADPSSAPLWQRIADWLDERLSTAKASVGAALTLLLLVALAGACAPTAPTQLSPALRRAHCAKSKGEQPLCLVLDRSGPKTLRARIFNTSSQPRVFLHQALNQPTKLSLVSLSGQKVPFGDERRHMKFDNTLYRRLYRTLTPGAQRELGRASFLRTGDTYSMSWDAFRADGIRPGTYRAQLRLEHRNDRWVEGNIRDAASITRGVIPGIFKGTLVSNSLTVTLP